MEKNNRGFTLIELMIAIAVLSVMSAMLFQTFALSGGIAAKSRVEERLQEAAKKTMEELKGYSFTELEKEAEEYKAGDGTNTVVLGETEYEIEPLPSGTGYLLKHEYRRNPTNPSFIKEKADYLIEVLVDWGIYSAEPEGENRDSPYSINQYRMPNIVDVGSLHNVVIDPDTLIKDDELRMGELLLKVNGAAPEGEGTGVSEEDKPAYTEDHITKFLHMDLSEKTEEADPEAGKMIVKISAIYTVDSDILINPPRKVDAFGSKRLSDMTITTPVLSSKRHIVKDKKTGKSINRIYLFLPEASALKGQRFDRLYVTADTKETYEVYVVAADSGLTKTGFILLDEKKKGVWGDEDRVELYTNLRDVGNKQDQPVSYDEARRRLCHLTVSIYEADYINGGAGDRPVRGEKVLQLDSTKAD